jgi:Ca2+:H+ antiporter
MSKWFSWNAVVPVLSVVVLAVIWGEKLGPVLVGVAALFLVGAVIAAVHHAEVVAHRVGEPFGSLILAAAVTIIEVALIVTLMTSGGNEAATLARDTAFAALMITTNGIAGLSLLLGSRRYGVTLFNAEGAGAALASVTTVATLSLVLPAFTTGRPDREFTPGQLAFAAIATLLVYLLFVFTQTMRHRDFFLPIAQRGQKRVFEDESHADPPTRRQALSSLVLLLCALVAVVGLAEEESPAVEHAVVMAGLNLAYGSAMASIGLTIPTIALASIWLKGPLVLGLGAIQLVLLALTVVISMLTVVPGRATRLQGEVHLVLLAAYVFLAINP